MAERVPPGRAGRLWLQGRLAAARRSQELLERKRRLLRREQERLSERCRDSAAAWAASCPEAEQWAGRAALLGGTAELELVSSGWAGRARVEVTWRDVMGVRVPDEVLVQPAEPTPIEAAAANSAVGPAAAYHRRALVAAVDHAAAQRALAAVEGELQATQQRLRAIEHRRLPVLEEALRQLELRLDEVEREERVVSRWAQHRARVR
jgi:V/A-type H+/Na+-transporting ATPase subunit D